MRVLFMSGAVQGREQAGTEPFSNHQLIDRVAETFSVAA